MGFSSFLGRVLFASIFIISAWQMRTEATGLSKGILSETSKLLECLRLHAVSVPGRTAIALTNIYLHRLNDFGEDGGPAAKELAPKLVEIKELIFTRFGVKLPDSEARQLVATSLILHLACTTLFLYDFYNYGPAQPEFFSALKEFLQNVALFGALLFFLGMKKAIPRRQLKKKAPKPKAA
ncbi:hypothetical protein Cgig2_007749 [Carnegiea gigantea]|uniref:Uncharacterized protein n=1 Tax=Carnegiea gigantea TaxID=171969 RepID=A0A9Q1K8M9_9CARY|nr:hypothetical protein Cgig2_007749 [Carnegiea gigantea]